MDQERYDRIKEIVIQACDLPAGARALFLAEACLGDQELLVEANSLLACDAPAAAETDDADPAAPPDPAHPAASAIGPYRLCRPLGEGGMGVVYLAEQAAPLRRQVALKIIKHGMDTREVIARFESERQALALMDHPNIAKVLDAGATEEGRPYFVMEYIRGLPLTQYCGRHELDLGQRLDLFVQVCRGIHHAHQKGLIHRDIKPGNILVTEHEGRPLPKIIDFGVAKATDQHVTAGTIFTRLGHMIGTPEYMSPEQANPVMADVDIRSDVYSLGVVLYELLTGVVPIGRRDLLRVGLERMGFYLSQAEPPPPSLRLTQSRPEDDAEPESRRADSRIPAKSLRGDLDWVTMKALARERERRYGTAADFADDLERYLQGYPVKARPPGGAYRLRKFARRNRAGVTAGLLFLAALIAGVIGTTVGMVRARQAKELAVASARRADAAALYQLARNADKPVQGIPYILAAIEKDDRPLYRRLARRLLLQTPPLHRLPPAPDAHNPHAADISPDGRWLAVGWAQDGALQLFDLAAGTMSPLRGHRDDVLQARFSRDARWLVTAGSDSTVRFWSLPAAELSRTLRLSGRPLILPGPLHDRLITATAQLGRPLLLEAWPLAGGAATVLGTVGPPVANVWEFVPPDLDPAGRWLALPDESRIDLYAVDALAAGPARIIGRQEARVEGVAFSPDGTRLASFDAHGNVYLWSTLAVDAAPVRRQRGKNRPLHAGFDAPGRRLAVSGWGGISIWDLELPTAAEPMVLDGAQWMFKAVFHPHAPWIVTISTNRLAAAWPTGAAFPISLHLPLGEAAALRFSRDGRWLVAASDSGTIQAWPLAGTRIGEPRTLLHRDGFTFEWVRIDEGSRFVYAASCNGAAGAGTVLRVPLVGGRVENWEGCSCAFEVDAANRRLASSASPHMGHRHVKLLDLQTGDSRFLDRPDGGATVALGFLADGRLLAHGPAGLGIWSPEGEDAVILRTAWPGGILAMDRETLVTIGQDGQRWLGRYDDLHPQPLPLWFDRVDAQYSTLAMAGSLIASAAGYDELEVIELPQGPHHRLPLFKALGYGVCVDPLGRWIASAGDGLIKLVPLPLDQPWETIPRDELLALLRTLTNLRAVPNDILPHGYELVGASIPDWENPPSW